MSNFETVKNYLMELGIPITKEDPGQELFVVSDESQGLSNLIIDCEAPILVLEQFILVLKDGGNAETLKRLLQLNRGLVHGAFVLDDSGTKVLFRDTLQLENLDLNELKGSIDALSLGLASNADELIGFAAK